MLDQRLKTKDGFVSGVVMTPIECEMGMKADVGTKHIHAESFHKTIGHANYATAQATVKIWGWNLWGWN